MESGVHNEESMVEKTMHKKNDDEDEHNNYNPFKD